MLASELAEAEAKEGGQRASATPAVPPSQHDVEEEEAAVAASAPGAQQQTRAHRNSSKRGEVPSPPPSTKPAAAGARGGGAAPGASSYPFYSTCPSLSNNDHSGRRHRRQAHKRGCGLGAWLEGVARYHEEKFIEGWERALRWFL